MLRLEVANLGTDLADLFEFVEWMERRGEYSSEHCKWASLRYLLLGYRALEIQDNSPEEEVFRLGCIYWIALAQSRRLDQRCASISVHRLRAVLALVEYLESDTKYDYTALALWAALGCLIADETFEEDWFAGIAVDAAKRQEIHSIPTARGLSGRDPLLAYITEGCINATVDTDNLRRATSVVPKYRLTINRSYFEANWFLPDVGLRLVI